ncbi:MAG TPA: hypothetical protein VES73_06750, partial [Lamprocystis sp. (in: g-proteobacteria)]|nr:hypothetical protein [Lamprocystis sp. (in: g-proteobacteria)]
MLAKAIDRVALGLVFSLGLGAGLVSADDSALADPVTKTENPFWDQASAGYFFRAASFRRASPGDAPALPKFEQYGAGVGGWLYGNTGEIRNFLSFGASLNFTLPVFAPEEYPYNFILRDPEQEGFSVLGEAYAKLRYQDNALIIGRQSINNQWFMSGVYRFFNKLDQSMVGRREVRGMHPITYEAVTIQGKLLNDSLRYYAGYVADMKQINDIEFRNLYQGVYQLTIWPSESKQGDT